LVPVSFSTTRASGFVYAVCQFHGNLGCCLIFHHYHPAAQTLQVIRHFFIIGSIPSPFSMPPLPFRLSQVIHYFFIIGSISSFFFLCHHYLLDFLRSSAISSSLVLISFRCHHYLFRLSQVIRYFFIIGSISSFFSMPPLPFRLSLRSSAISSSLVRFHPFFYATTTF
ncbi:hypothetical protein CDAR_242851, partial [Caerostris darwini]